MTIVYKSSLQTPYWNGRPGAARYYKAFPDAAPGRPFQYQKFKMIMIQPLVDIPGAVLFDLTPQRPHVFRLYG